VFSLGVVLHELLTGKPLFARPHDFLVMQAVCLDPIPTPSATVEVAPEVERVVMKALARDPSERYESALALRRDLSALLAGMQTGGTRPRGGGARAHHAGHLRRSDRRKGGHAPPREHGRGAPPGRRRRRGLRGRPADHWDRRPGAGQPPAGATCREASVAARGGRRCARAEPTAPVTGGPSSAGPRPVETAPTTSAALDAITASASTSSSARPPSPTPGWTRPTAKPVHTPTAAPTAAFGRFD
jgi:serine/threonine-protein kinase